LSFVTNIFKSVILIFLQFFYIRNFVKTLSLPLLAAKSTKSVLQFDELKKRLVDVWATHYWHCYQ